MELKDFLADKRNDSGSYTLKVDGKTVEAENYEIRTEVAFRQTVEGSFAFTGEGRIEVNKVEILDTVSGELLGMRILPRTLIMYGGDTLNITWTTIIEKAKGSIKI